MIRLLLRNQKKCPRKKIIIIILRYLYMCACLCRNILLTAESPIHSLVVTLKLSITMTLASDKNICTLKRVLL